MSALTRNVRIVVAGLALAGAGLAARADDGSDDRLFVSGAGVHLSDSSGGGTGSLGWLHNFTPSTIVGLGGEYDALANTHWAFGSLSGSATLGPPTARTSVYGEVHEGAGDIGSNHHFDYSNVAGGVYQSVGTHFTLQLEDRQIDVDTSHGNLPKVGAAVLWGTWLQTSVAYQKSVTGNLGTSLGSARIDLYTKPINLLAGGAWGRGAPAVINLETNLIEPGSGELHEWYGGVSKTVGRHTVTLVGDYLELSGFKRETVTLTYMFDLRTGNGK
jgi:hypothetical protein